MTTSTKTQEKIIELTESCGSSFVQNQKYGDFALQPKHIFDKDNADRTCIGHDIRR